MRDALEGAWLKWLAGSPIPARWLYPAPPPAQARAARTGELRIEIVSHCWRYARLLAWQLGSLVHHPVREARVTLTVFHAREDRETVELLARVAEREVPNLRWNWRVLPPERLRRRAIGRNIAALESEADWLWFTDCDLLFGERCLDSLNRALQGRRDALVHPRVEAKSVAYGAGEEIVAAGTNGEPVASGTGGDGGSGAGDGTVLPRADPTRFFPYEVTRATGPLQIAHGDVARAIGYCRDVPFYQRPAERWRKAVEDRMFRYLLGTDGVAVDVENVLRIQHAEKGRYRAGSRSAALRRDVRAVQHGLRERRRGRRR